MIDKDQLAAACCTNDRGTDHLGLTVAQLVTQLDVVFAGAHYVGEQRAMRLLLHLRGEKQPDGWKKIQFSQSELVLLKHLTAFWIDGLTCGLRVARENP